MATSVICNLKRAHPIIEKREEIQIREVMREYTLKNNKNKRLKLKFNKKLFIKSLLENLDFKKSSSFLKNNINNNMAKSQTISEKNIINEILKTRTLIDKEKKIKRALSYKIINEEKDNLNEIFRIKSNKKFMHINNSTPEMAKNNKNNNQIKQKHSLKNNEKKLLISAKNIREINNNNYNHFLNSLKNEYKNNNKNYQNILLSKKRTSENFSENHKNMHNNNITQQSIKSFKSDKSIKSNGNKQPFLIGNFYQKIKVKKYVNPKYVKRNEKFKKLNENNEIKYIKINKNYLSKKSQKEEYIRFLEKKSLSLRANIIMNNIHDSRGRKQELRSLYNPLNV